MLGCAKRLRDAWDGPAKTGSHARQLLSKPLIRFEQSGEIRTRCLRLPSRKRPSAEFRKYMAGIAKSVSSLDFQPFEAHQGLPASCRGREKSAARSPMPPRACSLFEVCASGKFPAFQQPPSGPTLQSFACNALDLRPCIALKEIPLSRRLLCPNGALRH